MNYPVVEIFKSIQGEGCLMGKPATFIRLAECNLACPWCDTDFSKSKLMSVAEILEVMGKDAPELVVITGGEPTLHDLTELLQMLQYQGCFVAIETNGTNPVKEKYGDLVDWVTCSPKPQHAWDIHPGVYPDELKYVVDDVFYTGAIKEQYRNMITIWLQPEGSNMQESAQRAAYMVTTSKDLRLGIQMHKIFDLK